MIRRVNIAIALITLLVSVLVACDKHDWKHVQGAPSLRPAFGARVTDGQLQIWMGSRCDHAREVNLEFGPGKTLVLSAPEHQWASVDRLTLGGPYPGLRVTQPLPAEFDWRTAEKLTIWINGDPGSLGAQTDLAVVREESVKHPDDTYWFQDVGWLNPTQVAADDSKTFLALCTPDPAYKPSVPTVFGVRETDGLLRIWTGSPCPGTTKAVVTFEPSGIELVLTARDAAGSDFQRYTVGDPIPDMDVSRALPKDFDWTQQRELQLNVSRAEPDTGPQRADLGVVRAESASHPADTYWFQGIGWLNPTQVAEQDGKTFLATCTREPKK
ncbi:hypothetical protein [Mycolicibacterium brisbanense]|uniref:Lipoprotein n=1 Tax=Mycolicibacterium brisbanense TaxID=146020 RepID=A0A117I4F2_9MYCO|nr:hypothetical protein [Mycolicibacterium brisbanense]MCV7160726.1 hypothetical protein [Mycolicibacterium brisbanense]GAS86865.1 uncharacterized protein RMCB_0961 [Mycolicibacterium brisbanense]